MRPSWAAYYKATDAVIVVIDSTDRARVSIAKVSTAFSQPVGVAVYVLRRGLPSACL